MQYFLCSKNVMHLQTAFALILDSQRVKEGEQMLEAMRKEKDFERALATFVSNSQQYNQRLLAILQLEKRLVVEDEQTVWSLKEVYFRDSDKIAHKICKIVTAKENIWLASEFLVAEQNQTGSSIYRQVQVVFHLLKEEDKAIVAIEHHFELLCRYFQTVAGSLSSDEDCFFLVLVCLLLFYDGLAKGGFEEHKEAVLIHWAKIEGMIDCNCENAHLIVETIRHILHQQPINPKPSAFFNLLDDSHSKNNPFKISYLCKALQLIMQTHQLEAIEGVREEFISSMMRCREAKTRQMLINLKLYGDIEVQLNDELELQDNNETIVRRQCNNFIEAIFTHHQQWLQQYLQRSNQPLQTLLTLVNYYHSITLPSLGQMMPSLIERVVDEFGQMIKHNKDFTQSDIALCATFIQFLNTFKAQIEISSLPNIVSLLIDGAIACPNLSPFCDSFVCDIWKELAFTPYCELAVWMGSQLQNINRNEWGVRLKSYEGFLNLAVYLEQAYHHFSTCPEDDKLLEVLARSHSIMCEIMRENTSIKTDFELVRVLLAVTSSIIENERFKKSKKMHEQLSISFLVGLIERHLFLDEDTAVIVAFHRYHSNQLIANLQEETKEWPIDQLDYDYRIQLYITELDYAQELLPEVELQKMKQSLQAKIHAFLNTSQRNEHQSSKSGRLWSNLQHHYGIIRQKTEMMDIQC